jgi:prophage tail gpP-like protein
MSDVQLRIGATVFSGWKTVSVDTSIEFIAGSFEITMSEVAPDSSSVRDIRAGTRASLSIADETVITGYIDVVEPSHQGQDHSLTVRGRDATADLVDCAAIHKTGQWRDQDMLAIARDLVRPFGITVRATVDVGRPFSTWNVEPSESVFENLDRMARHRGVLLVSDGRGGLLLTSAGSERAPTALVLGQNILSGGSTDSHQSRYSEYIVMGQRPRDDDNFGEEITEKKALAKDAAIRRYRPIIEIIEDVGDVATYQRRAEWRRNVSAGRGTRATITTQGWRHSSGLWRTNRLVTVTDKWLRMQRRELLIVSVGYRLDGNGTRSELTLMPRASMLPEAIPEVSEDGL